MITFLQNCWLSLLLTAIIAYLLGSISFAIIVTRRFSGKDIRSFGSGNAGATNMARVYGMVSGLYTLFGDMAKAGLAGLCGWLIGGHEGLAVACLGCLVGHCWPVFFSFKGGKGVSVSACIGLLFDWRLFIILLITFFVVFVLFKRVSLSSICCAVVFPTAYILLNPTFSLTMVASILIGVCVICMHHQNIKRLIKGEEAKFSPKSAK